MNKTGRGIIFPPLKRQIQALFTSLGILLFWGSLISPGSTEPPTPWEHCQPALRDYAARLSACREQLPALTASAQAAAEHILARPDSLLNVPYWEQISFSEEMINRAGGLAHMYPSDAPDRKDRVTDHDWILLTVRSWEEDSASMLQRVKDYKAQGGTVTMIASRAGRPADLTADFFIDNGAPSGSAHHGRINLLTNVTLGWMWCCEYVAAMTRQGKIPGVLLSVSLEGAEEYDRPLQTPEGRHWIGSCDTALPAGQLAETYLQRVEQLIAELGSPRVQGQVVRAARIVAAHMADGGTVGLSGVGHLIIDEVNRDLQAPWKAFQAVGRHQTAFRENLQPGDLLVWIAYMGMNSKYTDFASRIHETQVDLITSFAHHPDPAENETGALAHIDQCWELGDAVVPLPVPPGRMAPLSGISSCLILRMLDDEVGIRWNPPATTPQGGF